VLFAFWELLIFCRISVQRACYNVIHCHLDKLLLKSKDYKRSSTAHDSNCYTAINIIMIII